jgi:DNA modification methylase
MRSLIAQGIKVQCCVTSPPYYGLRDYGHPGQLGLEPTPDEYVANMVEVFRLVKELLADDGTLWLNLGDSYSPGSRTTQIAPTLRTSSKDAASGKQEYLQNFAVRPKGDPWSKPKDLLGIPWRVAFALQADGWYLRQDIIWHKPNPMPESVRDRCTKAHEYVFLMAKEERYYFDGEAMQEPATNAGKRVSLGEKSFSKGQAAGAGISPSGNALAEHYDVPESRNRRSVWTVPTSPYSGAHFATFPPALIEPMILAGSRAGDTVLDPFFGSGTTGQVAQALGRKWIGIELNEAYAPLQTERTAQTALVL